MKVIESHLLYEGKLRAVRETLESPQGKRFAHETIEHPGAVVILPLLEDGRIVFIEQYRHSVRESILELPAGTLEKGEEPEFCAQRELMEEIGMACRELISLGTLLPAPGFCNEVQHIFCAKDLYPREATPDEDEVITVIKLSVAEVEEVIRNGRLRDSKSLALLMRARISRII